MLSHVQGHFLVDLTSSNNFAKLFITNFPILVGVNRPDGLVYNLLELRVLQVVADHHLQHLEELAVGHEPVVVHVVDPEAVQSSKDKS